MTTVVRFVSLAAAITAFSTLSGCNSQQAHDHSGHDHSEHGQGAHAATSAASHGDASAHNHGDEGPHGGHLIELGHGHTYHAELIENDATESVTVYILDTHMDELPIEQETILLNVIADGQSNAYQLTAVDGNNAIGHSRFESADKQLFHTLGRYPKLTGKLRVTIKGVPYIGHIARNIRADGHSRQTR